LGSRRQNTSAVSLKMAALHSWRDQLACERTVQIDRAIFRRPSASGDQYA
jgi:hypothetical protein